MKRMRKGQLTLLVIVGLVLLLSVTLIIAVQQTLIENQLQAQAQAAVSDFIQQNSIEQYITSCLDNVATEGVRLLMLQGGVLYDYQGGLTRTDQFFTEGIHYLPYHYDNQTYNVSYAIGDTVFCPGTYIFPQPVNLSKPETGYYPVPRVFFEDYSLTYSYPVQSNFPGCNGLTPRTSLMSGYLGSNTFPKLCSYNGSNAFSQGEAAPTCAFHYYDTPQEPFSVQRQLETYITSNLASCINLSIYEEELANFNITVDTEAIQVRSTFQNPRGILFQAEYPFLVSIPGSNAIYRAVNFQTTLDVRLRQLYDFAYRVIFKNVRDPYFTVSTDYTQTQSWTQSLQVQRERLACANCTSPLAATDDVFVFTDETSILRGEQLRLHVATQQRKPLLNYLHDPTQTNTFNGEVVDFLFLSNGTIQFFPEGVDPDEDNITYTYFGWKEDYDTWFNFTKCQEAGSACTLATHEQFQVRVDEAVRELSTSPYYTSTQQAVGPLPTNESHIGFHEIQILIEDEHGAQDFQTVKFLVFDIPVARLNGSNEYADINNTYAALEERYTLDGSASTASVLFGGSGISAYVFTNSIENFGITTTQSQLLLPLEEHSFANITQALFQENLNPTTPVAQEFTLAVRQEDANGLNSIASAPTSLSVTVTECLPHGYGVATPNNYPLPPETNSQGYTNYWGTSDPFDQPNVCCEPLNTLQQPLPGGTYRDENQLCFSTDWLDEDFLTCFPLNENALFSNRASIDKSSQEIVPLSRATYPTSRNFDADVFGGISDLSIAKNNNQMNDLFQVDHTQYCSGERGNNCGGQLDIDWNTYGACADLGLVRGEANWQFARCSGPGQQTQSGALSTLSQASCVGQNLNYLSGQRQFACLDYQEGESFEKDFLGVSSSQYYDYGQEAGALIATGSCAPNASARVVPDGNGGLQILTGSGNQLRQTAANEFFSCQATCSQGSCDYRNPSACSCQENNVCDGVLATQVYINGQAGFYCSGNTACTNTCQAYSSTQVTEKAACHCLESSHAGNTYPASVAVNNFFDSGTAYELNGQGTQTTQLCCHTALGNTLTTLSPTTNAASCFQGRYRGSGVLFSSLNPGVSNHPDPDVLSCNGQLYRCGLGPTFAGVTAVAPSTTTYCGYTCVATVQGDEWQ